MVVHGHARGRIIVYLDGEWVYEDTKKSISVERPCVKCDQMPTKEGHDPCLGYVEGAESACCGHGVEDGYVIMKETVTIPKAEYDELMERIAFLDCLEGCGVDNWEGYSDARDMMEEEM